MVGLVSTCGAGLWKEVLWISSVGVDGCPGDYGLDAFIFHFSGLVPV